MNILAYTAFDTINGTLNQLGFYLDSGIKISDFTTTLAIVISIITLLVSLKKDRDLRSKEQADRVRSAAAKTLAKLERWKEISVLMFAQMDSIFVDTSKSWVKNEKGENLRNTLWEELDKVRIKALESIIREDIESAYHELYSFDPSVRTYFDTVISLLKDEEAVMFQKALLPGVQNIVGELESITEKRQSAKFRNSLITHAIFIKRIYEPRLNKLLFAVSNDFLELINKSNDEILFRTEPFFRNLDELDYTPVVPDDYGIECKEVYINIESNPEE